MDTPSKYVAIRRDHKSAFKLTDLRNCLQTELGILCVPQHNTYTYTGNTCLLHLLKGKENETCDFSYTTHMTPYFTRVKRHWIGSVPTRMVMEEVCDEVSQSRTITLEPGVLRIPIREGCQILSREFFLPKFT